MPWYVYGLTRFTTEAPPADLRGVDDAPIAFVGSGDLQVVAGEVSDSFREVATAPDDELLDAVRRHDDVLRELVRHRPLLPVRFGTLLDDEAAIAALLADADGHLRRALDHVADAAEWVVTVSAAPLDPPPDHDDHDEALTPGHAFFARRRSAAAQRQRRRAAAIARANALDTRLRAIARDFRPLDLRDPDTVARGAYLVPRDASRALVEAVRPDGAAHVEVQGPLPPYRFAEAES